MSLREDFPWLGEAADFWEPVQQAPYDILRNVAAWHMLPSRERARGAVDAARTMGSSMTGEALAGLTGLYEGARSAAGGGPFLDPAVQGIDRFRDVWGAQGPQTIGGQAILGAAEAPEQLYRPPLEAGAEALFESTQSPLLATGALLIPEVIDSLMPGKRASTVRTIDPSRPTQTRLFPDEFGKMEEPAGALDSRPFYSKLEQAITDAPQETMTAKQWSGYLQKQGVKPDEMKWTGMAEELQAMGDERITKGYLLGGLQDEVTGRVDPNIIVRGDDGGVLRQLEDDIGAAWQGAGPLELPEVGGPRLAQSQRFDPKWEGTAMIDGPNYREYQINLPASRFGKFEGGHWNRDDNTLMHLRTTQRQTPQGESVFFIDEIQSDWHQQGRQRGYDDPDSWKERRDWRKKYEDLEFQRIKLEADMAARPADQLGTTEANRRITQLYDVQRQQRDMRGTEPRKKGIPEAPFKNTWVDMGAKLAIDEAIKRGDEYVAFPTGEYLKDAYDADLYVETMYYDPSTNELVIDEHARLDADEALEAGMDPQLVQRARDSATDFDSLRDDYISERARDDVDERYDFESSLEDEFGDMTFTDRQEAQEFYASIAEDDVDVEIEPDDYDTWAEYQEAREEWIEGTVEDRMDALTEYVSVTDQYSGAEITRHYGDVESARDQMISDIEYDLNDLDNDDLFGEDYIEQMNEEGRIDVHDSIIDPNSGEIAGPANWLDTMLPQQLEKFLKKNKDWNTQLEYIDVDMPRSNRGEHYVPAIRITDEMRKAVRERGQPLFMRPEVAGAGLGAGALAAQQEPSEEEPRGRLSM